MTSRSLFTLIVTSALTIALTGCLTPPGKPAPGSIAKTPDQVLDFPTLYAGNCAACHGAEGKDGAAMSLSNPVYLATAGVTNIQRTISRGVTGTMMPPFATSTGGSLTDKQITALAQGLATTWGNASALNAQPLPYASHTPGDPAQGAQIYVAACASCHGAKGEGAAAHHTGSLVDPAYLALISDQGLRSIIVAGKTDEGMPDWRHDLTGVGGSALTDQQVTDTVAWLGTFRSAALDQPHP